MKRIALVSAMLFTAACSSSKDATTTTPSTTLTGAAASANQAVATITKMAIFTDTSAAAATSKSVGTMAVNAKWTQTGGTWGADLSTEEGCSGAADPKSYMDNMLYSGCAASNFWNLIGMFKLSCAVFASVPQTGGIPNVAAEQTLNISATVIAQCDLPADISDYLPITATVEATTDTTTYQRKVTMGVAGTAAAYTFWYGTDGTTANIQFKDPGVLSPGGNGANFVGFYSYNSATEITMFELQGRYNQDSAAFFVRLLMNDDTEVATALGTMGDFGTVSGTTSYVRWSTQGYAGDPAQGDPSNPIAVNMAWKINGQAADDLSTCVTPGTYVSDGTTSSCGTYSAPAAVATVNSFVGGIADGLITLTDSQVLAKASETTKPNFTAATIHSAAIVAP